MYITKLSECNVRRLFSFLRVDGLAFSRVRILAMIYYRVLDSGKINTELHTYVGNETRIGESM